MWTPIDVGPYKCGGPIDVGGGTRCGAPINAVGVDWWPPFLVESLGVLEMILKEVWGGGAAARVPHALAAASWRADSRPGLFWLRH